MKVIKAVIPAAGVGTRFLPATKSVPKEMLPLLDKPALQYSVEEGIKSGIQNFIVVLSGTKNAIADHFDTSPALDAFLRASGKEKALASTNAVLNHADFTYVRQQEPLGLGHALWSARHAVGREHIAVFLPDDVLTGVTPAAAQLIKIASQEKCNVVAVAEMPVNQISSYGVVAIKKQFSPNLFQVKSLVEKPSPTAAPSNLAIIGRYVLSPGIFDALENTQPGTGGEIQLTDAISSLLTSGEKVFAYKVQGTRYDIGTPLGWIKANIAFALKHPKYSQDVAQYLASLDRDFLMIEGRAEMLGKKGREVTF